MSRQDKYPYTMRALHWVSALVILWAMASGLYAATLADHRSAELISLFNVSVTTLFIPVFVLRVFCRLYTQPPLALDVPLRERIAARIGHLALYTLTFAVLLSGVLMMERNIEIFDWVSLPQPVHNPALNRAFARAHRWSALLLGLAVVLHVAAVIRHELRGVRVWRRMSLRLSARRTHRDAGGCAIFAGGDIGAAHVRAHRYFDAGQIAEGRKWLGQWLEGRTGSGSQWVHIQFHMALFELALGDWDRAYARFSEYILPASQTSDDALTDAPALLWQLQLASPNPVVLPWQPLRNAALRRMHERSEPFVELHNLLAIAGAGDVETIDRWVHAHPPCVDDEPECLLRRLAIALRAYAARAYRMAAEAFDSALPQLVRIGGSRQQHSLFTKLAAASRISLAGSTSARRRGVDDEDLLASRSLAAPQR